MAREYLGEITDGESFSLMVSSRLAPDPYSIYLLTVTLAEAAHHFEEQSRWQRRWGRIMLATLVVLGILVAADIADIVLKALRLIR